MAGAAKPSDGTKATSSTVSLVVIAFIVKRLSLSDRKSNFRLNINLDSCRRVEPRWRFLTKHARVLLCIANDPDVRLWEIGNAIGITERAAHRIGESSSRPAMSLASEMAAATATRLKSIYPCPIRSLAR